MKILTISTTPRPASATRPATIPVTRTLSAQQVKSIYSRPR